VPLFCVSFVFSCSVNLRVVGLTLKCQRKFLSVGRSIRTDTHGRRDIGLNEKKKMVLREKKYPEAPLSFLPLEILSFCSVSSCLRVFVSSMPRTRIDLRHKRRIGKRKKNLRNFFTSIRSFVLTPQHQPFGLLHSRSAPKQRSS
jgi:hypothetical protein